MDQAESNQPWVISRAIGRIVLIPRGALDAGTATRLRNVLLDLIDGQGNLDVVIDALHVSSIDEAALGVLLEASTRMSARGGNLRVSGPPESFHALLAKHGLAVGPR